MSYIYSDERRERIVHLESHVLHPSRRRRTDTHRAARALPAQVRERLFEQHGDGRRLHQRRADLSDLSSSSPPFYVLRLPRYGVVPRRRIPSLVSTEMINCRHVGLRCGFRILEGGGFRHGVWGWKSPIGVQGQSRGKRSETLWDLSPRIWRYSANSATMM